jgi:flagellar hook-length control protein FliK
VGLFTQSAKVIMDAPSLSVVTPAPVNLVTPVETSPGSAPSAMRGADFANLLGHLMNPAGRQDLAAAGLQSVPLGPQIEVITAAEPLPDAASLAAFAKGQGLDDAMVRALFGTAALEGQAAGVTLTAAPVCPLTGALLTPEGQGPESVVADQPLTGQAPLAVTAAMVLSTGLRPLVGLMQSAEAEAPPPPTSGEAIQQQALALATGGVLPALVGRGSGPGMGRAEAAAHPAGLASSPVAGLEAGRIASLNVSQLSWQVQSLGAPQPVSAVQELQSQAASAALSETSPEDLPEALRLRLAPSEFITQRLAAMAGTGEQATWGSVAGQSVASGLLRLDMRGLNLIDPSKPLADQALAGGDSAGEDLPTAGTTPVLQDSGRPTQHAAASTATPWTSTAAQRAEQYEQLAQRLGEALGQRLQSQLERGDWKLQMRLDPAHLGRIDLDLDMSAGGLDAVFRSDNQVTRDLIAQSLGRLRESLSQSGTAVANVWVQGDSSRQSGGNPTPGRAPDEQEGRASGRDAGSDERIAATAVQRPRQGTSAWDVLA